ncbi:lamin tail domain-containing protein, partial [Bacteroidota bacterium]
ADPSPVVGLPEYDYLELFNKTSYPVYLENWTIKIGENEHAFLIDTLPADSFLIVCPTSAIALFEPYGLAHGILSTTDLTNSGKAILLNDNYGTLINTVVYSDTWYNEPLKAEGGYSLEKIDPLNNCSTSANWKASVDASGGTPGRTNSVFASNIDNSAPLLSSLEMVSANQLLLTFNEIIDTSAALLVTNYLVDNGIGNPDSVVVADEDFLSANLYFLNPFPDEDSSHISITGVEDLCGNIIADTSAGFLFYIVKPNDVVINEILADPSPVVGLPDYEFIELHNVTSYKLKLVNWKIKVNTSEVILPEIIMPADSFVILTSTSGFSAYDTIGLSYGISSFPSLLNSGAEITIKDSSGNAISIVTYSDAWYQDDFFAEGGYSLEKIDPLNNCSTSVNWKASVNASGGTPGRTNSVFASNIDNSAPFLSSLEIVSANQLFLTFNEIIDTSAALLVTNYLVDNGIGNPDSVLLADNEFRSFDLYFSAEFPDEDSSHISITGVEDLCGNIIADTSAGFLFYIVKPYDVVINEILADPEPAVGLPEYDYLEIYNRSNYKLNLKDWSLTIGIRERFFENIELKPDSYLIITTESGFDTLSSYGNTIDLISGTDLTSTGKLLVLKNKSGTVIHSANYNKSWYHDEEKEDGGWSLELIDPGRDCGDFYNWSASMNVNGGTPGEQNSIFGSNIDLIPPDFTEMTIISSSVINIVFSEYLDSINALNIDNYILDETQYPDSIIFGDDQSHLLVYFSEEFSSEHIYQLTILNQQDLCGNTTDSLLTTFTFYLFEEGDIVINEIMIDPTPGIELPEYEYIEIYNNSEKFIDLTNWILDIDGSQNNFSQFTLNPNSHLILCSSSADSSLQFFGQTHAFSGFSTLSNTADQISIIDTSGNVIDGISYKTSWYHDEDKVGGGWSIERIDPNNLCGDINNWTASIDLKGGTPGQINSVFDENIDTYSPEFEDLYIIKNNIIGLEFNEPLSSEKATNVVHYFINENIGFPDSILFNEDNIMQVKIYFSNELIINKEYLISIENLEDLCGNKIENIVESIVLNYPESYDIVFNELMINPDSTVGLPDAEFIEIYNNSFYNYSLSNWQLSVGDELIELPLTNLNSNEYLVLSSDASEFAKHKSNSIIEMDLPGLNNTEEILVLYNDAMKIMSAIKYSKDWYQDEEKAKGGYSLELIDPSNPIGILNNWRASINQNGGTPGIQNSILAENPDDESPALKKIIVLNDTSIQLFFSEPLNLGSTLNKEIYFTDNGLNYPEQIQPSEPFYDIITLCYTESILTGIVYNIFIENEILDISGNQLQENTQGQFALPEDILQNNIIINEVLFNPSGNGVDYVEIYNNSEKTFDLNNLFLASRDEVWNIESKVNVERVGLLFFGEEYLVLTTNPAIVKEQYFTSNLNGFQEMESFPSLPNNEGIVLIMKDDSTIIDEFHYSEEMQFSLLNTFDGVALERIDFNKPTNEAANWYSASKSSGYGTPAYENSQHKTISSFDKKIEIEPEVFSPDEDGYNDVLHIQYQFNEPGYVANIIIFNSSGKLVKQLVKNELLATSGFFLWDGTNQYNLKASIGIYIIYFEVFDLNGNVEKFKKVCVLASKF